MVVEAEIDNLPGEGFGFLMERLLEDGALDVYYTAVQMKKNRPGSLVTVLCRRPRLERLAAILLTESGSLGCRYHAALRLEAEREILEVATAFGAVRSKRARLDGRPLAAAPEFDDCRRLALASGASWRDVYRAALTAAGALESLKGFAVNETPITAQGTLEPGLAGGGAFRWAVADITEVMEEVRDRFDLWPVPAAALGRCLAGAALLQRLSTKTPSRLMLDVRGDGPIQRVLAEADDEGNLRGMVGDGRVQVPDWPGGKLGVGRAVGKGFLRVLREYEAGTATTARSSW